MQLNNSQKRAIQYFQHNVLGDQTTSVHCNHIEWKVEETQYGTAWITAKVIYGSEDSLLRCIGNEPWFVHVGQRGRLEAYMAPKSYHQFAGKQAFGVHFRKTAHYV